MVYHNPLCKWMDSSPIYPKQGFFHCSNGFNMSQNPSAIKRSWWRKSSEMGSSCWNLKHRFEKFGIYNQNKGKSKQHRHKTLTLLQYFKTSGFQILIKSRWESRSSFSNAFCSSSPKSQYSAEYPDCPAPTLPQVDFLVIWISAENSSEEVTLKYGKLCDVCFSFSGWNTTRVFK